VLDAPILIDPLDADPVRYSQAVEFIALDK
jgi:hypothetical protein